MSQSSSLPMPTGTRQALLSEPTPGERDLLQTQSACGSLSLLPRAAPPGMKTHGATESVTLSPAPCNDAGPDAAVGGDCHSPLAGTLMTVTRWGGIAPEDAS